MAKTYNLFISHSWSYGDNYERLVKLLNARPYFSWKDYSVPRDDPVHTSGSDAALYSAIRSRVQLCHVVLVLAGVYASYSRWINNEVEIAQGAFTTIKPIVAIEPFASQRTSTVVKAAADRVVKWNTESVVRAIREVG